MVTNAFVGPAMLVRAAICATMLALLAGVFCAPQAKAEEHPAVSSTPESSTETYGDWALVCSGVASLHTRVCEVDATISLKGQNAPIARIAFARLAKDKPFRVVVQTPANVTIAPGVKLEPEANKETITLGYRTCAPTGCFSEADITSDQVKSFRGRSAPGQLTVTDSTGKSVALPFSLRGFDQALDAMGKH